MEIEKKDGVGKRGMGCKEEEELQHMSAYFRDIKKAGSHDRRRESQPNRVIGSQSHALKVVRDLVLISLCSSLQPLQGCGDNFNKSNPFPSQHPLKFRIIF